MTYLTCQRFIGLRRSSQEVSTKVMIVDEDGTPRDTEEIVAEMVGHLSTIYAEIQSHPQLEILVYFYFDPKSGMLPQTAKGKIQEAIFKALGEHNIKLPYPHSSITVDHNDKNLIGTALYVAKETMGGEIGK